MRIWIGKRVGVDDDESRCEGGRVWKKMERV